MNSSPLGRLSSPAPLVHLCQAGPVDAEPCPPAALGWGCRSGAASAIARITQGQSCLLVVPEESPDCELSSYGPCGSGALMLAVHGQLEGQTTQGALHGMAVMAVPCQAAVVLQHAGQHQLLTVDDGIFSLSFKSLQVLVLVLEVLMWLCRLWCYKL